MMAAEVDDADASASPPSSSLWSEAFAAMAGGGGGTATTTTTTATSTERGSSPPRNDGNGGGKKEERRPAVAATAASNGGGHARREDRRRDRDRDRDRDRVSLGEGEDRGGSPGKMGGNKRRRRSGDDDRDGGGGGVGGTVADAADLAREFLLSRMDPPPVILVSPDEVQVPRPSSKGGGRGTGGYDGGTVTTTLTTGGASSPSSSSSTTAGRRTGESDGGADAGNDAPSPPGDGDRCCDDGDGEQHGGADRPTPPRNYPFVAGWRLGGSLVTHHCRDEYRPRGRRGGTTPSPSSEGPREYNHRCGGCGLPPLAHSLVRVDVADVGVRIGGDGDYFSRRRRRACLHDVMLRVFAHARNVRSLAAAVAEEGAERLTRQKGRRWCDDLASFAFVASIGAFAEAEAAVRVTKDRGVSVPGVVRERMGELLRAARGWHSRAEEATTAQTEGDDARQRHGRGVGADFRRCLEERVGVIVAADALYYRLYYEQIVRLAGVARGGDGEGPHSYLGYGGDEGGRCWAVQQRHPSSSSSSAPERTRMVAIPHPHVYFAVPGLAWGCDVGEDEGGEKRRSEERDCWDPLSSLHRLRMLEGKIHFVDSGWYATPRAVEGHRDAIRRHGLRHHRRHDKDDYDDCQPNGRHPSSSGRKRSGRKGKRKRKRHMNSSISQEGGEWEEGRHETPAHPTLSTWRDSTRDFPCHLYGYAALPPGSARRIVDVVRGILIHRRGGEDDGGDDESHDDDNEAADHRRHRPASAAKTMAAATVEGYGRQHGEGGGGFGVGGDGRHSKSGGGGRGTRPAIIEIGAGTGYLGRLLQDAGADVDAYDSAPLPTTTASSSSSAWSPSSSSASSNNNSPNNEYHGSTPSLFPVRVGGPMTLLRRGRGRHHRHHLPSTALLMCYPPPNDPMADDALRHYLDGGGRCVVHVGEFGGLTGTASFERRLLTSTSTSPRSSGMMLEIVDRFDCLHWGTDASSVTIWRRRKGGRRGTVTTRGLDHPSSQSRPRPRPVPTPCVRCRDRPAARRCVVAREIAYCDAGCFRLDADRRAGVMRDHYMIPVACRADADGGTDPVGTASASASSSPSLPSQTFLELDFDDSSHFALLSA